MVAGGDRVEARVARDDRLPHALPEAQHGIVAPRGCCDIDEQAEFHAVLHAVIARVQLTEQSRCRHVHPIGEIAATPTAPHDN